MRTDLQLCRKPWPGVCYGGGHIHPRGGCSRCACCVGVGTSSRLPPGTGFFVLSRSRLVWCIVSIDLGRIGERQRCNGAGSRHARTRCCLSLGVDGGGGGLYALGASAIMIEGDNPRHYAVIGIEKACSIECTHVQLVPFSTYRLQHHAPAVYAPAPATWHPERPGPSLRRVRSQQSGCAY